MLRSCSDSFSDHFWTLGSPRRFPRPKFEEPRQALGTNKKFAPANFLPSSFLQCQRRNSYLIGPTTVTINMCPRGPTPTIDEWPWGPTTTIAEQWRPSTNVHRCPPPLTHGDDGPPWPLTTGHEDPPLMINMGPWGPTPTIDEWPWGPTTMIDGRWQAPTNVHGAHHQDWRMATSAHHHQWQGEGPSQWSMKGHGGSSPQSTNSHGCPQPQSMNGQWHHPWFPDLCTLARLHGSVNWHLQGFLVIFRRCTHTQVRVPLGFWKTHTRTHENPHLWTWVWVLMGTGAGYSGKPQGSPWHSLVIGGILGWGPLYTGVWPSSERQSSPQIPELINPRLHRTLGSTPLSGGTMPGTRFLWEPRGSVKLSVLPFVDIRRGLRWLNWWKNELPISFVACARKFRYWRAW